MKTRALAALRSGARARPNSTVFRATYALNLTTHGAADTVGANCVVRGIQPGDTQNPDFDHRGLLVNIDNLIIQVRTTECERQSFAELRARICDESANFLNFRGRSLRHKFPPSLISLPRIPVAPAAQRQARGIGSFSVKT